MTEEAGSIADLMKVLIEDRRSREAQYNEEKRSQQEAVELERAQMREQLEMLRRLVGHADEERPPATQTTGESEVKLVKLSEQDDIESYLTTFERIMRAYEVKEKRWAVKLAPQLTGKAQQAYAAMKVEDAGTYRLLKEAILRRYDISEETYRQRFRDAERKDSESVSEIDDGKLKSFITRLEDDASA